jgi:PAS domain S-box-containing protein
MRLENLSKDTTISATMLRQITENMGEVFWLRDVKDQSMLYINPAYEKIWGRTCKSLYDNPASFLDAVHPDDLAMVKESYGAYLENGTYDIDYRIIKPSGEVRWVKTRNFAIKNEAGEVVRDTGLAVDITYLKVDALKVKQQSHLQEILMNTAKQYINIPLDKIDQNIHNSLHEIGSFVQADRAYVFTYDWEAQSCSNTYEWCNKGITPQIGELQDVPISMVPDWAANHILGNTMYIKDVSALDKDSGIRQILEPQDVKSLIAVPMMHGNSCVGFIGFDSVFKLHDHSQKEQSMLEVFAQIMVNISVRKELEDNLIFVKNRAETANRTKSEFLANMSHEIRTPLNGVIGFAELLKQTKLDEPQTQYIDTIANSANSLLGIINDILDLSKIEAGKLVLDLVETDIYDLMNETLELVKYPVNQKKLDLSLLIDPNTPRFISVDPIRLRQVILNLLSNAIKFTSSGTIDLAVSFKELDKGKGAFYCSVTDSGIGIEKSLQHKLFQAFGQADSSTTRIYGGTGLGLTISDKLIRSMGGNIEIESEPGVGSTFSFSIDVDFKKMEKSDIARIGGIKSVLFIDDDKVKTAEVAKYFEGWKIAFHSEENGLSALKAIKKIGKFDVILVKYNMPFIDGIDTIKMMREKLALTPQKQPILLLHDESEADKVAADLQNYSIDYTLNYPAKVSELYNQLVVICDNYPALRTGNQGDFSVSDISMVHDKMARPLAKVHKIMIVEDFATNMLLATTIISQLYPSAEILKADNGAIAVELFNEQTPDIIFMDVQMPVLDGNEATVQIRNIERTRGVLADNRVPVVGLTAGAMKEEKEKCMESGMDDFLTKPIQLPLFKKCLAHYLDNE